MKKIHVVVIDSGINVDGEVFQNMDYTGFSVLNKCDMSANNYKIATLKNDCNGHGTAVTYLLYKLMPNAQFTIVNCYDDDFIEEEKLIYTLTYILEKLECDIINLSSGVISCIKKKKLYELCEKFKKKGTIIVAAFDNFGAITYPACFDNVIGVDGSPLCRNFKEFEFLENAIVNIRGCIHTQNLMWGNDRKKLVEGNSFIVPHVVKMVYDIISVKKESFEVLLQKLKEKCKREIILTKKQKKHRFYFPIKKAVCFPFNKEVNLIARFSNELQFEVLDFYDVKYLGNVGKELSEFSITGDNCCKSIKNIDEVNWEDNFDTFILGHTKILEFMMEGVEQYTEKIVSNCIKYKKNLFAFDKEYITSEIEEEFNKRNLKIYYPEITVDDIPINTVGKLYTPCVPSVAIFGTSSKQGKFTLQLKLRQEFVRNGYKVGQIGTEPASLLFGFDYAYPLGYNAHNQLLGYDSIRSLNHILMQLETENEPEIIIVGSQSHTIPITVNNISNVAIYQQDILYAIRPDVCLLCINIDDTLEYIQKNIMFLESLVGSKVIALILSPANFFEQRCFLDNNESFGSNDFGKEKNKYSSLGIPVYLIEEIGIVVDTIIDYLSS